MYFGFRRALTLSAACAAMVLTSACTSDALRASKVIRDKGVKDNGVTIAQFRENLNVPADNTEKWWQQFSDATLDKLVHDAKSENINLLIAQSRLKQARAQGIATVSGYAPQLTVSDSMSGTKIINGNKQYNAATGAYDQSNQATNNVSLGASWEVPLFGRLINSMAGAKANRLNAEYGVEAAKIALVSDVSAGYFELRSAQIALNYLKEDAARSLTLLNISKERYRVGLISKSDLALSQSQYSTIAAQLPDAEIRVRAALDKLAILRGVNPGELDELLALKDESGFLFKTNVPNLVSVPADYIRRRPDVMQVEQQAVLQAANVGISQADMYPRVSLGGSISLTSNAIGNAMTGDILSNGYSPSISLPLFDFGQRWASVKIAGQQFTQALLNYKLTVLNALAEGQQSLVNYNQGQNRLTATVDNEDAALTRLKAAEKSYEVGLISMKERVEAERDYSNARLQRLNAQAGYSNAAIGIYRTFAGSPEIIN